jgi:hypothetical protein
MLSDSVRLPSGALTAAAVIASPRPGLICVATLVCRCSKLSTDVPLTWARTREVHMGCTRPCRESSARVHISFTGLPIARETSAASSAASKKSLRPNDPPPSVTCTVTLFCGSPSSFAISACAAIGFFSGLQISAPSRRTSAIAAFVSSALPEEK